MANRFNDVVNTKVGQDELAALQCELFAAAREALAAAREEGKIPSSLITSCHQIVKDSGMRPDTEGLGDTPADVSHLSSFNSNWLRNVTAEDLDLDVSV